MKTKKDLGQYFTTDPSLQQYIFDRVKYKGSLLLEPSFGEGHLLLPFLQYNPNYPIVGYEIDKSLPLAVRLNPNQTIHYTDFLTTTIFTKFKTIIGNPPYVKNRTGNLYLKFIEKCLDMLDENGELIFIVPSDFIKITHASKLIQRMSTLGCFTHFWYPNNEGLFEDAVIDVMVFRFQKDIFKSTVYVNDAKVPYHIYNGSISFVPQTSLHMNDVFDVYVGMVTGMDQVFHSDMGNIQLITDKGETEPYIYITEFPSKHNQINTYLEQHKPQLMGRQIKKFTEKNWFEWGAPRNVSTIHKHRGEPCIYMHSLCRKKEVAFLGKVDYFTGTMLCLIPKEKVNLKEVCAYLNSEAFQKNYMYSGRFKIGQRQLLNAPLPI